MHGVVKVYKKLRSVRKKLEESIWNEYYAYDYN